MVAPIISFRTNTSLYPVITSLTYLQTKESLTYNLPTKEGEKSDTVSFRIYNNWELTAGVASAENIVFTTYDSSPTYTASIPPVSQSWLMMYESGYGENSSPPGLYSQYLDVDTAVGGSSNLYSPAIGSDAGVLPIIRAGTDTNGAGFIELVSYMLVPENTISDTHNFILTMDYQWST